MLDACSGSARHVSRPAQVLQQQICRRVDEKQLQTGRHGTGVSDLHINIAFTHFRTMIIIAVASCQTQGVSSILFDCSLFPTICGRAALAGVVLLWAML